MKIVFMGTPEFSVGCLGALVEHGHEVAAVFTREDKPKNRGMSLTMPPVKEVALTHNIPVHQPKSLRKGNAIDLLRQINPDCIVVVAYGRVLPIEILTLPKYGCINVHASLLPKYRGASPIQTAIVSGESQTGVTIMQMDTGIDTGDMLYHQVVDITEQDTGGSLHNKLAIAGAQALITCLGLIEAGQVTPIPQGEEAVTHAPMIAKEDGKVIFSRPAKQVANHIMGYLPWPGAFAQLGEVTIKFFEAYVEEKTDVVGEPGAIVSVEKDGMVVACQLGSISIKEIQKSGGKRMKAEEFFRGRPELLHERFV